MTITLTDDFASVTQGPITLQNNTWGIDVWGHEDWVNGRDYMQTLRYEPGDLTRNVRFDWVYNNPGGNILTYPEIILGYKPWDGAGDHLLVGQISKLKTLTVDVDIDIRGETDGFNIAYDLWLTDTPAGDHTAITSEVMIWLHPGGFDLAGSTTERLVTPEFSALVYHEPDMNSGSDQSWKYTAVIIDGGRLDGEIDINLVLQILANRGYIDRDDYLSAVELGAEVQTGAGGFTLNRFDWQHARYSITEGENRLSGTVRDDRIASLGGDDTVQGGDGSDRLIGGDGRDRLFGEAGADRLWGSAGADRLTGGSGADRFVFAHLQDMAGDRVLDFAKAEQDRIDLRQIDAIAGSAADNAFRFVANAAFSGRSGELQSRFDGQETVIRADTDGDRQADFTLRLHGRILLDTSDFLL